MKKISVVAAALAACCGTAIAAGPFDAFKGKMKEGLYEYTMKTEMPGMPAGMAGKPMTIQHCVTAKDLDQGNFAKSPHEKDCSFEDVKVSGNTASYKMVCKGGNKMNADVKMTFGDGSFMSDTKMTMSQGPNGQPMTVTQHMEGKYIGACK
jgi:hypothetical protein